MTARTMVSPTIRSRILRADCIVSRQQRSTDVKILSRSSNLGPQNKTFAAGHGRCQGARLATQLCNHLYVLEAEYAEYL